MKYIIYNIQERRSVSKLEVHYFVLFVIFMFLHFFPHFLAFLYFCTFVFLYFVFLYFPIAVGTKEDTIYILERRAVSKLEVHFLYFCTFCAFYVLTFFFSFFDLFVLLYFLYFCTFSFGWMVHMNFHAKSGVCSSKND